MLRAVAGVIVGYVAMVIVIMVSFMVAGIALGTEGMFKPGVWEPSNSWLAMSLVVSLLAAIVGGAVCAFIAGRRGPAKALVVVVIVLGALSAVFTIMNTPEPKPRPAEVTMQDVQANTRSPAWVAIAFPIIGVVGVLIGAKLKKDKPA